MLKALKTLPKLTTLDMQLPHVKKLDISGKSIHLLFNLEVDDRGASFVAQNLKSLTTLNIGKQWNN
jgi:hypothetical protein